MFICVVEAASVEIEMIPSELPVSLLIPKTGYSIHTHMQSLFSFLPGLAAN